MAARFTDKACKKISLLLDPSCLDLCLIHVGEVTVVGAKGNLGRFINNCRLTEKDQESIYDYNYVRVFAAAAAKKCYCKSGIATAFFSESNASLARQLAELMQEANQRVKLKSSCRTPTARFSMRSVGDRSLTSRLPLIWNRLSAALSLSHPSIWLAELYIAVGVWNIVKLEESDEDLGRHIHNDDKDVFRKMIRVCEPDADTQKACVLLEEMIDHQV
ncbi:hypothetical protein F2Q69_00020847 [Brassica cretica]|uniref:Uncharacterized protein n=1 Tax=Brassica cretica TaxID=69181 RepID=A0A8S9QHN4_BRACR|nr:hypothetical protein F2Q69_00020847 [Brassica cretica]